MVVLAVAVWWVVSVVSVSTTAGGRGGGTGAVAGERGMFLVPVALCRCW